MLFSASRKRWAWDHTAPEPRQYRYLTYIKLIYRSGYMLKIGWLYATLPPKIPEPEKKNKKCWFVWQNIHKSPPILYYKLFARLMVIFFWSRKVDVTRSSDLRNKFLKTYLSIQYVVYTATWKAYWNSETQYKHNMLKETCKNIVKLACRNGFRKWWSSKASYKLTFGNYNIKFHLGVTQLGKKIRCAKKKRTITQHPIFAHSTYARYAKKNITSVT